MKETRDLTYVYEMGIIGEVLKKGSCFLFGRFMHNSYNYWTSKDIETFLQNQLPLCPQQI